MSSKAIDILFWTVKYSSKFLIGDKETIDNLTTEEMKKLINIRKFLLETDRIISKELKYSDGVGGDFQLKNFCNLIKMIDYWMYCYSQKSIIFLIKWKKMRRSSKEWLNMVKN